MRFPLTWGGKPYRYYLRYIPLGEDEVIAGVDGGYSSADAEARRLVEEEGIDKVSITNHRNENAVHIRSRDREES